MNKVGHFFQSFLTKEKPVYSGEILEKGGKRFRVKVQEKQHGFLWQFPYGLKALALTILTGGIGPFFFSYVQNLWKKALTGCEKVIVLKELPPDAQKADNIRKEQLQDNLPSIPVQNQPVEIPKIKQEYSKQEKKEDQLQHDQETREKNQELPKDLPERKTEEKEGDLIPLLKNTQEQKKEDQLQHDQETREKNQELPKDFPERKTEEKEGDLISLLKNTQEQKIEEKPLILTDPFKLGLNTFLNHPQAHTLPACDQTDQWLESAWKRGLLRKEHLSLFANAQTLNLSTDDILWENLKDLFQSLLETCQLLKSIQIEHFFDRDLSVFYYLLQQIDKKSDLKLRGKFDFSLLGWLDQSNWLILHRKLEDEEVWKNLLLQAMQILEYSFGPRRTNIQNNLKILFESLAKGPLSNLREGDCTILFNILFNNEYKKHGKYSLFDFKEITESVFARLFASYRNTRSLERYAEDVKLSFSKSARSADKVHALLQEITKEAEQKGIAFELSSDKLIASNLAEIAYLIQEKQSMLMPDVNNTQELWQKLEATILAYPQAKFIKFKQIPHFFDKEMMKKLLEEKPDVPLSDLMIIQEITCTNDKKLQLAGFDRQLLIKNSSFFATLWQGPYRESQLQFSIHLDCSSSFLKYAIASTYRQIDFSKNNNLLQLLGEADQRDVVPLQKQLTPPLKKIIASLDPIHSADRESIKNIFAFENAQLILYLLNQLGFLARFYDNKHMSLHQETVSNFKTFFVQELFPLIIKIVKDFKTTTELLEAFDHNSNTILSLLSADQIKQLINKPLQALIASYSEQEDLETEFKSLEKKCQSLVNSQSNQQLEEFKTNYLNIEKRRAEIKNKQNSLTREIEYVLFNILDEDDHKRWSKLFEILKDIPLTVQSQFNSSYSNLKFKVDSCICQIQPILVSPQTEIEKKQSIQQIMQDVRLRKEDYEKIGSILANICTTEQVSLLIEFFADNRWQNTMIYFMQKILKDNDLKKIEIALNTFLPIATPDPDCLGPILQHINTQEKIDLAFKALSLIPQIEINFHKEKLPSRENIIKAFIHGMVITEKKEVTHVKLGIISQYTSFKLFRLGRVSMEKLKYDDRWQKGIVDKMQINHIKNDSIPLAMLVKVLNNQSDPNNQKLIKKALNDKSKIQMRDPDLLAVFL